MSFDSLDRALVPMILGFLDPTSKLTVACVSRTFWKQCQFIEAAWDFDKLDPGALSSLLRAKPETSMVAFNAFNTTKITLGFSVDTSADAIAILRMFPTVIDVDMRRCWGMPDSEWDAVIDTLEKRDAKYLGRLEAFANPYSRLYKYDGGFTFAALKRLKASAAPEDENPVTDDDADNTDDMNEPYDVWYDW